MALLGSPSGVVIDIAGQTDPGRDPSKQINEDAHGSALTSFGPLVVVCDGMGGHSGGQNASHTALSSIIEGVQHPPAGASAHAALKNAIELAGRAVFALGGSAPNEVRPGSTCAVVLLTARDAHLAHVGDSRIYLVRDRQVRKLTRDHSLVEEMVDAGVITRAEAAHHPDANKITRALGIKPQVEVEQSSLLVIPGDVLVLASDGLTDLVTDAEIAELTASHTATAVACAELTALANQRGGYDNITVQVVRVLELPQRDEHTVPTLTDMQGAPASPAKTLVYDPHAGHAGSDPHASQAHNEPPRRTRTTVPDEAPPATRPELPAKTLLDEGPRERLTEPARAVNHTLAGRQARAARRASMILVASAIFAGLVVGGVAVWWLVSALGK